MKGWINMNVRKLCVILIVFFYTCGSVPLFMGWYNRPGTIGGISVFILGILLTAFLMLAAVCFLYWYEEIRRGEGEKDDSE